MTALAFTLSILCNGGTPKWESLTEPLKGDTGKADDRFDLAESSIQELFAEKCTFLDQLKHDKESTPSGCSCKKNCTGNCGCRKNERSCTSLCACDGRQCA